MLWEAVHTGLKQNSKGQFCLLFWLPAHTCLYDPLCTKKGCMRPLEKLILNRPFPAAKWSPNQIFVKFIPKKLVPKHHPLFSSLQSSPGSLAFRNLVHKTAHSLQGQFEWNGVCVRLCVCPDCVSLCRNSERFYRQNWKTRTIMEAPMPQLAFIFCVSGAHPNLGTMGLRVIAGKRPLCQHPNRACHQLKEDGKQDSTGLLGEFGKTTHKNIQ